MTDPATPAVPPRAGPSVRRAAPALLGYAAVRALGVAVLAVWSAARGTSAHHLLTARWDSVWYVRVAASGYGYEVRLPGGDVHSNLAFFPLLPWLERAVAAVTPLPYADAGLLVSTLASLAAAWGVFAVADLLYGRRAGICAVLAWAVLPVGVVQSMAYSESLFTALAAWSLYAVLTGRWLTAGALAAAAGLTRPVGMAVAAAVWTAAFASFARDRRAAAAGDGTRSGAPDGQARGAASTAWRRATGARAVAVAVSPLGAVGYVLWVGRRTGAGPLGYLDVQAGWGNGFDGGYAFTRFVAGRFTSFPSALAGLALVASVALLLALYAAGVRQGQPHALLAYTGIVLALALCASGYFGSKPRLLLPAFPLLFPLARALARLRPTRSAGVLGGVAAVSAVYGAFWLNGSGPP
ncbi:glycosyltransferase family 39 protein [Streptomyces minutiscleroticus]|uniref:glycosyltransferase family 39 protein n=1 Tax=Streptomyces minutiscleroticus TaxID=68238 RepID=UPI00332D8918